MTLPRREPGETLRRVMEEEYPDPDPQRAKDANKRDQAQERLRHPWRGRFR